VSSIVTTWSIDSTLLFLVGVPPPYTYRKRGVPPSVAWTFPGLQDYYPSSHSKNLQAS
jgi:hypothetical protein